MTRANESGITVRYRDAQVVAVESFGTARQTATQAALSLGLAPDVHCTLAHEDGRVIQYDDPAPTSGTFLLVDSGGPV